MTTTDLTSAEEAGALFDRAAQAIRSSPYRKGSIVQLPATGRLLVTGDLHDNPEHLGKIVQLARLDASA
ncbi:MAG: hypothetical protein V3T53_08640, partial [Phycisphaerales bacterium]